MAFSKTILKNGLRVITAPMAGSPTATVLVLVEAGSKYETKAWSGLSHFLEHMCFKGTHRRPTAMAITKELDGLGAQSNAFTSQEYTGYWAKAQAGKLPELLDIVADIYLDPLFDPAEIEKEKGVIVQEINMYEDMPMRHVHDLFMEALYGDQPAGWNIAGPKETVVKLTREDFLAYRGKHYQAPATTVAIAGGFDEKNILALIEEKFRDLPGGTKEGKLPVKEEQTEPRVLLKRKETDQTHVVWGVRSKDLFHKDLYALDVLAGVLGGGMSSRLFHRIREEMGAAYYVRASNDSYTDHGVLAVSVGSDNRKIFDVISAGLEEFSRLTREEVSEEELRKVKNYLVGHLFLDVESTDALANFLGIQELLMKKARSAEEVAERIESVTTADLKRLAGELFRNDRLTMALIGPFDDPQTFSRLLSFS